MLVQGYHGLMNTKYPHKKVTLLEGFYASGDYECFCFGKFLTPREHNAHMDAKFGSREERYTDEFFEEEERVRVHPESLLPEHQGLKGTWRVTVEFCPEEQAPEQNS